MTFAPRAGSVGLGLVLIHVCFEWNVSHPPALSMLSNQGHDQLSSQVFSLWLDPMGVSLWLMQTWMLLWVMCMTFVWHCCQSACVNWQVDCAARLARLHSQRALLAGETTVGSSTWRGNVLNKCLFETCKCIVVCCCASCFVCCVLCLGRGRQRCSQVMVMNTSCLVICLSEDLRPAQTHLYKHERAHCNKVRFHVGHFFLWARRTLCTK